MTTPVRFTAEQQQAVRDAQPRLDSEWDNECGEVFIRLTMTDGSVQEFVVPAWVQPDMVMTGGRTWLPGIRVDSTRYFWEAMRGHTDGEEYPHIIECIQYAINDGQVDSDTWLDWNLDGGTVETMSFLLVPEQQTMIDTYLEDE